MEFNVDMNALEKQRYDAIKKSGEYLEFNVLIPCEKEQHEDWNGKMPVVTTCMHGAGPEEIANLYAVLCKMVEFYEKRYPAECLFAKLTIDCTRMADFDVPLDRKNEEE